MTSETPTPSLADQVAALQEQVQSLTDLVTDLSLAFYASKQKTGSSDSVALGTDALAECTPEYPNVAVGLCAGVKLQGQGNVLVGPFAGFEPEKTLKDVTVLGNEAGMGLVGDLENVTLLGAHTHPTGSHQVVLGDNRTHVYSHNALQRRADYRDRFQEQPLTLGLDFVLNINPVEYQDDHRERYVDWASKPSEPLALREPPQPPTVPSSDPGYQPQLIAYRSAKALWLKDQKAYEIAQRQYGLDLLRWVEENQLRRIRSDGSQAGTRKHFGFKARELLSVAKRFGIDAGFVQDHSVNGGEAVHTVADVELVACLWLAVQQLSKTIHSQAFLDELKSALLNTLPTPPTETGPSIKEC